MVAKKGVAVKKAKKVKKSIPKNSKPKAKALPKSKGVRTKVTTKSVKKTSKKSALNKAAKNVKPITKIVEPKTEVKIDEITKAEIELVAKDLLSKTTTKLVHDVEKKIEQIEEPKTMTFWKFTAIVYIAISLVLLVFISASFVKLAQDPYTITYLYPKECTTCSINWLSSDSGSILIQSYSADVRQSLILVPSQNQVLIFKDNEQDQVKQAICTSNRNFDFC